MWSLHSLQGAMRRAGWLLAGRSGHMLIFLWRATALAVKGASSPPCPAPTRLWWPWTGRLRRRGRACATTRHHLRMAPMTGIEKNRCVCALAQCVQDAGHKRCACEYRVQRNAEAPEPLYKNFYPRGTFSTLAPHCPTWPTYAPPSPHPTPPPLLRWLHRLSMEAAPATMAQRGQSHAPDPGLGLGLGSPSWWNQFWFYNPF